jgi:hypothetical protein
MTFRILPLFSRLFSNSALHSLGMKAPIFALILLLAGCGGSVKQTFAPTPTPTPVASSTIPSPTPTPTPVIPNVTITAASVFSMSNIGQNWTFTNGYGDTCEMAVEAPQANNVEPDGSIINITWTDTSQVAGRTGDTAVIHFNPGGIKSNDRCYWMVNVHGAELWFPLHFEADGSSRSISSVMDLRNGCPWCGPTGQASTDPYILSSQVVDNQPGMPMPYLITPPTVTTGDHLINDTRVCGVAAGSGLTYDPSTPAPPLCGPTDGEYWRTDFYIDNVSTPVYTGPAIASDQFEGMCGHEKWYFAPGWGIVKIEQPYDGGEIKNDPRCIDWLTHDPKLDIVRTN